MLIDSHAHLEDYEDLEEVLKRARESGVRKIVASSYNPETALKALEFSFKYNFVYPTAGVHPNNASEYSKSFESFLKENSSKLVAIGEIGLDYHYEPLDKALQAKVFRAQLSLASQLCLPVVIHMRDATADTLDILKDYSLKGVLIHCFNGSVETLDEVMKRGYYVSFGGAITFKNAKNFKELLRRVDKDKFMLETDSPYLSPEPFRGKRNEPKNVALVCKKVASELNLCEDEVAKITSDNAIKFFGI